MNLGDKKPMTPAALEANRVNGKLGGRPKGAKTGLKHKEIAHLARQLGPEAIDTLKWHMRHCDNPAIRVACANNLLDRGYGRPSHKIDGAAGAMLNMLQVITGVPEPDPVEPVEEIMIDDTPIEIEGEVVENDA